MNKAAPKTAELRTKPRKPGPPTLTRTLAKHILDRLDRIKRYHADILNHATKTARSPEILQRIDRRVQKLHDAVRRDLAELRARITDQKPESPARNRTAAPTSSTIRRSTRSTRATERATAELYGPPTDSPDDPPEISCG